MNIRIFIRCVFSKSAQTYQYPRNEPLLEPENDRQREAVAMLDAARDATGKSLIEGVGDSLTGDYWLDEAWS